MPGLKGPFQQALFISLGGIGNLVLAVPALRALRAAWPAMKITLLTGEPGVENVLAHEGLFDDVISHDRQKRQPLGAKAALLYDLSRRKFDVGFASSGTNPLKAGLLMRLAGIPVCVGEDKGGAGWFYTHRVTYDVQAHEVESNLKVVGAAGAVAVELLPRLYVTAEEDFVAEKFLGGQGACCVVIHAGSSEWSRATRRWPQEHFVAVARELVGRPGVNIVLVGGPQEKGYIEELARMVGIGVINAAGCLSLRQTAALIRRCRLFIGNDSALAHLAAAVEVPVVVLFGLTDARHTRPRGRHVTVIQKQPRASGINPLTLITPEEVLKAADEYLGKAV